eukprot:jgi/Phyca11/99345/e_gw1.3.595.1
MATALPACTGVFVRTHCSHARLFEEEYKRSYCGSSLEVVLRFGSDSNVSNHNRQEPFDVANVFVFARFEIVDSKPLAGEYSLHQLRSLSQSEVNPEASWVEGVRQTEAGGQQYSQQLYGNQPALNPTQPESVTFVLNGQAFTKWYYHWESGANKVHRATKHALKAYVFYQKPGEHAPYHHTQQGTRPTGALELLCIVTSPPFTVVSYRRAPLEASTSPGGLGLETSTALVPHYATDPVDSRLRRLVQHQISRAFQEYNQQHHPQQSGNDSSDELFRSFGAERGSQIQYNRYRQLQEREGLRFRLLTPEDAALSSRAQIQSQEPRIVFDSTRHKDAKLHWRESGNNNEEDKEIHDEAVVQPLTPRSWASPSYELKAPAAIGLPPPTTNLQKQAERAAGVALSRFKQQQRHFDSHQREVQQLMDLAIIHFFASRMANKRSLANLEVVLTIAISQHWRYPSGGAIHLAKVLLAMSKDETDTITASNSNVTDEELTLVLAEVCVWSFSPENIELMQSLLTACHPLLLDSLEANCSEDDGKELRTAFLDCAGRCWNALNAFLQTPKATQTTIRGVRGLSDAVLGAVYSDPDFEDLRIGLRTMLQRPTVVLEDSKENTSILNAYGPATPRCNLAGWQAFVAQVREGYLVQADPTVLSRDNGWLRLICDGRVRVAPVSPNGVTSLVGASCFFGSDYVAYRLQQSSERLDANGRRLTQSNNASDDSSLCVEFYWWPFRKPQDADPNQLVAFRSVLTLKTTANGAFMDSRIALERGFVDREAIEDAEFPDLEHWAPTERVQAVASWETWLLIEGLYMRAN